MYRLYCAYSGNKYFFLVQLISASQTFCARGLSSIPTCYLKFFYLLLYLRCSFKKLLIPGKLSHTGYWEKGGESEAHRRCSSDDKLPT